MYVCVCIDIVLCVSIYIYIYIYIYVCVCVCVCVYIYIYIYIYMYVCIHAYICLCLCVCMRLYIYIYIYIYMCVCVCVYFFFHPLAFSPIGGRPNRRSRSSCVPDSFFTVVPGCEPQQDLNFHSQPLVCFIHPAGDSPMACHTLTYTAAFFPILQANFSFLDN